MTLEEYKSQCKAIREEAENFKGTQEEQLKFLEDLATKYPEVNEFNTKALQCNNVTEFKKLADSVGMQFSNEDSAEKLYSLLDGTKMQLQISTNRLENGVELSDDFLSGVNGGYEYNPKKFAKSVGQEAYGDLTSVGCPSVIAEVGRVGMTAIAWLAGVFGADASD